MPLYYNPGARPVPVRGNLISQGETVELGLSAASKYPTLRPVYYRQFEIEEPEPESLVPAARNMPVIRRAGGDFIPFEHDEFIIVETSATVQLPVSAAAREYTFKILPGASLTLFAAAEIDGEPSRVFVDCDYAAVTVVFDGQTWNVT